MEKSKYEEILEKLDDAKTYPEYRERLTEEELVLLVTHRCLCDYDSEFIKEGDERLISGIIRIIAENEPSFKRSVSLLDATKYVLEFLCRLRIN